MVPYRIMPERHDDITSNRSSEAQSRRLLSISRITAASDSPRPVPAPPN